MAGANAPLAAKRRAAEVMRAWKYGMTAEQLVAFFEAHGYACDICGKSADPTARGMGLVIDHDHACCQIAAPRQVDHTGSVSRTCGQCNRGLLCVACNAGIGQLQDDPEILRAAIRYLEKESD